MPKVLRMETWMTLKKVRHANKSQSRYQNTDNSEECILDREIYIKYGERNNLRWKGDERGKRISKHDGRG